MSEPVVTLTDYALALLCGCFARSVCRLPESPLRPWLTLFFAASALAPLLGGTVHGFFPDDASLGSRLLWPLTLLAIGAAALAVWAIGLFVASADPRRAAWKGLGAAAFCAYAGVVLFVSDAFAVAVGFYLPAALFLLAVLGAAWWRARHAAFLTMVTGVLVTLLAAAGQQLGVGLHPRYFDHNALYHLVQALGFVLLFAGGRRLVSATSEELVHADAT